MEQSKDVVKNQVFIVTVGPENPNKVAVALAQACHSKALGNNVLVFFVSNGFCWSLEGFDDVVDDCFGSIQELISNLCGLSAEMLVCQTCYDSMDRKGHDSLKEGVEIGTFTMMQDFINSGSTVVFSY